MAVPHPPGSFYCISHLHIFLNGRFVFCVLKHLGLGGKEVCYCRPDRLLFPL